MIREIYDWFFDENNGGIRRFYVILGLAFLGFFIYTNYYRLNDYEEVNQERIELQQQLQVHIANEARLETELEHALVEIDEAIKKLNANKVVDEKEKQVIATMSVRDKLDYLARAGYISPNGGTVSDSTDTR